MLTVLMMVGCMGDADPVRVSLDIDASDLVLTIGETSTRVGSSKAADSHFTYRTDNPSVATVDEDGEVTARSIGEATITVHMDGNHLALGCSEACTPTQAVYQHPRQQRL